MQTLFNVFKTIGALFMAFIYFILFLFVLAFDFCTFGLLKAITWLICKLFQPILSLQNNLFEFFNSHTTYKLWILGWVTSFVGFWYMIVRLIHWINDKLGEEFGKIYLKIEDMAKNIGHKGVEKIRIDNNSHNDSQMEE